jgi:hypothetical protein
MGVSDPTRPNVAPLSPDVSNHRQTPKIPGSDRTSSTTLALARRSDRDSETLARSSQLVTIAAFVALPGAGAQNRARALGAFASSSPQVSEFSFANYPSDYSTGTLRDAGVSLLAAPCGPVALGPLLSPESDRTACSF